MQKILVLFAHPAHRHSVAGRALADVASAVDGVTFVDLYAQYPRAKIDADREQARLVAHDVIVLQFPLMWYSTPSLLKEWQDLVLEYGFAYGPGGDKLKGKYLMVAATAGGPQQAYRAQGYNHFDIRTFLTPLAQTATLCGMHFLAPFVLFSSLGARGDGRIEAHAGAYRRLLLSLRAGRFDVLSPGKATVITAEDIA